MENNINPLANQVFSIPNLIKQQYEDLQPKVHEIYNFSEIYNFKKIIITGCGDSLIAGFATAEMFNSLTGIPTEVISSIELSRNYPENILRRQGKNVLVIAISNSGKSVRITEAILRMNKFNCETLGVTGYLESGVGKESNKQIELNIPEFEHSPGLRSYISCLISLILLAIRFGEVKSNYSMKEAYAMRDDLVLTGELINNCLEDINEQSNFIASNISKLPVYEFIGASYDYASALFGCAKSIEATGKISTHINSEDWFHLNFFLKNPEDIGTFLIASIYNPSHSRNVELVEYALQLNRPLYVITDGDSTDFCDLEATYIRIPKSEYRFNSILSSFVPLALIMSYVTENTNEKYGRGAEGKWAFAKGGKGIQNSKIIVNDNKY